MGTRVRVSLENMSSSLSELDFAILALTNRPSRISKTPDETMAPLLCSQLSSVPRKGVLNLSATRKPLNNFHTHQFENV